MLTKRLRFRAVDLLQYQNISKRIINMLKFNRDNVNSFKNQGQGVFYAENLSES